MTLILKTIMQKQILRVISPILGGNFLTEKVVLKIKSNFNLNKPINFINIISDDNCISNTQFNIDVFENS